MQKYTHKKFAYCSGELCNKVMEELHERKIE